MITEWNNICAQINAADDNLQQFIETGGLSTLQINKMKKFTKDWNAFKKMAEQFDQFVSPVDPIEVESWCDQDDFRYMWKMWKEYLLEQHGILMRSRMEQSGLDFLQEISEGNIDKAIGYIRFAMKSGYRSFFKVDEKAKSQPEKVTTDGDY